MGWLYMSRGGMGEHASPKTYLDAQFTYDCPGTDETPARKCRVVQSVYTGRVYYGAIEPFGVDGKPVCVTAVICLVRWNPSAKDGMIFGYKDMGESCGPCEAACPRSVLECLTSTSHPYALDWRRRCYRRLGLKERKIEDGDLIRFPCPLEFSDGSKLAEFLVSKQGRKIVLSAPDGRGRYTISRLLEKPFEIVRKPKVRKTIFPAVS